MTTVTSMSLFSRRYPTAMTQSFYWPIHAVQAFRRMMVLIDGESLVHRSQHMLTKGWVPRTGDLVHIPDSFIWNSGFSIDGTTHQILRATYHTYVVGDARRVEGWRPKFDVFQSTATGTRPCQTNSPAAYARRKRDQQNREESTLPWWSEFLPTFMPATSTQCYSSPPMVTTFR